MSMRGLPPFQPTMMVLSHQTSGSGLSYPTAGTHPVTYWSPVTMVIPQWRPLCHLITAIRLLWHHHCFTLPPGLLMELHHQIKVARMDSATFQTSTTWIVAKLMICHFFDNHLQRTIANYISSKYLFFLSHYQLAGLHSHMVDVFTEHQSKQSPLYDIVYQCMLLHDIYKCVYAQTSSAPGLVQQVLLTTHASAW